MAGRGSSLLQNLKGNFILVLGTEPGSGVPADTQLIKDFINYMEQFYEKETLNIRFPDILRQLEGSDTNIEIVSPSMLQPLQISITDNQIKDISVHIFVQTVLKGPKRKDLEEIEYKDAIKR